MIIIPSIVVTPELERKARIFNEHGLECKILPYKDIKGVDQSWETTEYAIILKKPNRREVVQPGHPELMEKIASFFDDEALKPVHVALDTLQSDDPEYILYLHTNTYIPKFVQPLTKPMMDTQEGSAALLHAVHKHSVPRIQVHLSSDIVHRHLKVPCVYDVTTGETHAYRDAARLMQTWLASP
jgi:hypothetical protein